MRGIRDCFYDVQQRLTIGWLERLEVEHESGVVQLGGVAGDCTGGSCETCIVATQRSNRAWMKAVAVP